MLMVVEGNRVTGRAVMGREKKRERKKGLALELDKEIIGRHIGVFAHRHGNKEPTWIVLLSLSLSPSRHQSCPGGTYKVKVRVCVFPSKTF